MFQCGLTGVVLVLSAIRDIRNREVSKKMVGIYFLLAVLGHVVMGEGLTGTVLAGVIPGVVCLLLSWISREALGYGDGMLILVNGISLGVGRCMELVILAFFFSGIWALVLITVRRAQRNREMPFVPFLLIGFGVMVLG